MDNGQEAREDRELEGRTEVPARVVGGEPQGAMPPTQVALIQHEPVALREFLQDLASPDAIGDQQALMQAYDHAVQGLLGPNDVVQEAGRDFKKKSAWRKLARFFRISTQVLSRDGWWEVLDGTRHFVAEVTVRAVAPWGQYMEAVGACSTQETRFTHSYPWCPQCRGPMWDNRDPGEDAPDWKKRLPAFTCRDKGCNGQLAETDLDRDKVGQRVPNPTAMAKARHDCMASAQTRATNRAVSDLVAAGEVSWEEAQGGDEGTYQRSGGQRAQPRQQGNAPQAQSGSILDRQAGFGQHADLTWRQIAQEHPDYAQWAAGRKGDEGARKLGTKGRQELGEYLDQLAQETAQDQAGQESQESPWGDPLDQPVPSGKHQGSSWREVVEEDLAYLERMLPREWGEDNAPVGTVLHARLLAAVEQEGQPTWLRTYHVLLEAWEVEPEVAIKFEELLPDVPERELEWAEEDYLVAVRTLAKHGVERLMDKARKRLQEGQERREAVEEAQRYTPKPSQVETRDSVVAHARRVGYPAWEDYVDAMEDAQERGDREEWERNLETLKENVLDWLANGGAQGAQEQAQEEQPEPATVPEEVQDDLPF